MPPTKIRIIIIKSQIRKDLKSSWSQSYLIPEIIPIHKVLNPKIVLSRKSYILSDSFQTLQYILNK